MAAALLALARPTFAAENDHEGLGGLQGRGILWIDVEHQGQLGDYEAVFADMGLRDFDIAMLGHVLDCVGPSEYGADDVYWYDPNVAARLAAGTVVRCTRD